MHPELLNNSLFLRYYGQWQKDPSSVVFVSIADYFMRYNQLDDAMKICEVGIKNHPELITGHLMLTRVYMMRGEWSKAADSLKNVFAIIPDHKPAKELLQLIERRVEPHVVTERDEFVVRKEVKPFSSRESMITTSALPTSELSTDFAFDDEITEEIEVEIERGSKPDDMAISKRPRAPSWETVTMANIYSAQGHHARAKEIYEAVLNREPGNADAKRGLEYLSKVSHS